MNIQSENEYLEFLCEFRLFRRFKIFRGLYKFWYKNDIKLE